MKNTLLKTSQKFFDLEYNHGAHNYSPLPVVIKKGLGVNSVSYTHLTLPTMFEV